MSLLLQDRPRSLTVFEQIVRLDRTLDILTDLLRNGPDSPYWTEAQREGAIEQLVLLNRSLLGLDEPALPDVPRLSRVIVESPYAAPTKDEIARNEAYARVCLHDCLLRGEAPYASHLLYTQPGVLDDTVPEERRLGIEAGLLWGRLAVKSVVYTDLGISPGMQKGIDRADAEGRAVEMRSIPDWQNRVRPGIEDLAVALEKILPVARATFDRFRDPDDTLGQAERILNAYRRR